MSRLDQDQCVRLVAHSNAGLFMPLLVTHAVRPIRCCLFVDAALPARARQTPAAPNQLLAFLRGKVNDGMPWATEAAADSVAQRARGREAELHWDQGSDYSYVLRHSEIGAILGMFGLHRRVGPTALEIGYWLHPGYLGRGYATRSVGVLTEVPTTCRKRPACGQSSAGGFVGASGPQV